MNPLGKIYYGILGTSLAIQAQTPIQEAPESRIAARVPAQETGEERDHLTGDWGGLRSRWVDKGFHFSAGYAGEFLSNVSGGMKRGAIYAGLLESALEVDPSKFSSWESVQFRISMLYPHGHSLSERYVGDIGTVSNLDADDFARLHEVWMDQTFFETFSVRFGQLAADEEFTGTEYGEPLMNATFGWPSNLGPNVSAPAYPVAAPGIRIKWSPSEPYYFQAAVYDGDANGRNRKNQLVNPHGYKVNLNEGAYLMAEAGTTELSSKLPATLKVGAWYHTSHFDHLRKDESGLSLADPASSGDPKNIHGNWGLYGVFEHQVWKENTEDEESDEGLGLFLRAGGNPSRQNLVEFYGEAGLHYKGLITGREEDIAAFGLGYLKISDELRRLGKDFQQFAGSTDEASDYEVVLEATYRFQLTSYWTLQPDIQYIIHPGGSSQTPNALILGLRTSLVF